MMRLRDVSLCTAHSRRRFRADRQALVRKPLLIIIQSILAALALLSPSSAAGQTKSARLTPKPNPTHAGEASSLSIPRLQAPPKHADFAGLEADTPLARQMLKVG
jgi:hypothetical protein